MPLPEQIDNIFPSFNIYPQTSMKVFIKRKRKMKVIGITGQIGSGKTMVAGLLRKEGFVVFDADNWCRQLYFEKDFLEKIHENFPKSFEKGVFNKRKLREIVFADPQKLKLLESLTHPFLKQKFLQAIRKNERYGGICFVDVALLFEMGWDKYCAIKLMTFAPYDVQKKRVMQRDKVSAEQADNIIKIQKKSEYLKKDKIDFIINTDRPIGVLKAEIIKIADILSC